MKTKNVILGIDPGFSVTGYAVIKKEAGTTSLIDCGFLKLPVKEHLSERIGIFYNFFTDKIKNLDISDIALETPFLGKNVQSFLKLGYLRGNLYLLAHQHSLLLHEFSPREVKQAVTGFGGASKDQVARMVFTLFPKISQFGATTKQDVTDAVAVCLSGLWHQNQKNVLMRVER